ncbi:hypothetical protein KA005_41470 [bacterium]|nr:hypothetical protein [bacterium]
MKDKESIYDKKIAPLMTQIIDICKEHELPFFASFQCADDSFCTSFDHTKGHPVFEYYDALKQSMESGGINIDKFMFWIMKGARIKGHSSIILSQLDVPISPNKEERETA